MSKKKIEFFIDDLKPEKQRELKEFLGGNNSDLDKTPFCTIKSDINADAIGTHNTQM